MGKANKYEILELMLDMGRVRSLDDIVKYLGISTFAQGMGKNNKAMHRLIENPLSMQLLHLQMIAKLLNRDIDFVFDLVKTQLRIRQERIMAAYKK